MIDPDNSEIIGHAVNHARDAATLKSINAVLKYLNAEEKRKTDPALTINALRVALEAARLELLRK